MLHTEALYEKVKVIQKYTTAEKLEAALIKSFEATSLLISLKSFFVLVDEARFEVEACSFVKEEKQTRYLQELSNFRAQTLERLVARDRTSSGPLFNEGSIERLGAISDAVSERISVDPQPIDREDFASKTRELIKEAKTWRMDEYAARSLLLGLGLIVQMTNSASISVSDADIRRSINRMVAGFAIEFASLDKEFETRWDTFKRWAKLGYKGASVPLGLTSNAVQIAGLLPKP